MIRRTEKSTNTNENSNGFKIYVGNLRYEVTEEELKEYFGQFGSIEHVNPISDRETGRGRGFAFIIFTTEESATAALKTANGQEFQGRKLRLDWADNNREGSGGNGQRRRPPRGGSGHYDRKRHHGSDRQDMFHREDDR